MLFYGKYKKVSESDIGMSNVIDTNVYGHNSKFKKNIRAISKL